MKNAKVIAIDGYSSCGKSTLAKQLAKLLNYKYIDSGAMYRAVTLYFLKNSINIHSENDVKNALDKINLTFEADNLYLNGVNVSPILRDMNISENVSEIAAHPLVRKKMVNLQRDFALNHNIIMDGRDIGTTVFPDANLKLFMIADAKVRAERRYKELLALDKEVSFEEVFNNIVNRDNYDTSREISPLRKANDAIILDNSYLNPQEQLDFVISKLS